MKHVPILAPKYDAERFRQIVVDGDLDACWEWNGRGGTNGYGRFRLWCGVVVQAPRFAYALAHGKDPGDLFVCHHCDNPTCCNPGHLFLGTQAENVADMIAKGRARYVRALNGNAKLNEPAIVDVREQILAGKRNTEIAADYGVTHHAISRIRRGKAWKSEPIGNVAEERLGMPPADKAAAQYK